MLLRVRARRGSGLTERERPEVTVCSGSGLKPWGNAAAHRPWAAVSPRHLPEHKYLDK